MQNGEFIRFPPIFMKFYKKLLQIAFHCYIMLTVR